MKQRYTQANFYTTTMQSGVTLTPSTSGRTSIPLDALPTIADNKYYHIIYNPADALNRFVMRVYNEGGVCYVDNTDIGMSRTLIIKKMVAIFDVAEMFNVVFNQIDDFGYVEYYSNVARIRGGYIYYSGSQHLINDLVMTSLANGTWYAVLDYTDNTLKFTQTYAYATQLRFGKLVVAGGVITYTDERGTESFANKYVVSLLSDVGGVLYYNGTALGTVTDLSNKVDKVAGKGLSTEDYTTAEKSKLGSLSEHYRGTYTSLVALQAAVPTGNVGDNATVDVGAGSSAIQYIWDAQDGWTLSASTGAVYSVNGLIGAVTMNTGNVPEVTDKRYVTDAQKTVLGNTSGSNSGDQTDATLPFTDITTNDASPTKHGFLPKLPNTATKYLRDDGTWVIIPRDTDQDILSNQIFT